MEVLRLHGIFGNFLWHRIDVSRNRSRSHATFRRLIDMVARPYYGSHGSLDISDCIVLTFWLISVNPWQFQNSFGYLQISGSIALTSRKVDQPSIRWLRFYVGTPGSAVPCSARYSKILHGIHMTWRRIDMTARSYNGSLGSLQISYSIALTFRLIDSYSRNEEVYFSYLQISGGIAWCLAQSIMHRYDDSFGSTPGSIHTASAILKDLTPSLRFFG